MHNGFYSIYKLIHQKKGWALLALFLLFAGFGYLSLKIEFEEDISKLIPTNDKTATAQKILKTVNFADKIIVNIRQGPTGSVEDLTQYASLFLDSIKKNCGSYIKTIQGKVNDEDILKTLDFVYKNLPLFLDKSDYQTIRGKIGKDSMDAITQKNYKTLISPSGIVAKETILKDPLGLSFMGLKKLRELSIGNGFTLHNGFLLSKDQKSLLLFITPVHESSETSENAEFAAQLYNLQTHLNNQYAGKVKSEYFGAALIAVANAQQIKRDIQFTVGIALTLLLIILIFFYKKLTTPLILFVPTVFGGLLSVVLLYFIRTKISAISLGIGSVLLGITLDYSLHILTHIRNNSNIEELYKEVAKPILMSSLTTALAFLCLLFLQSQALQDLGIFAATSVMGASVFALIFIPQVYKNTSNKKRSNTVLDRVAAYEFHKSKWALGLLAILLAGSFFSSHKVVFNKDISKLNYEPQSIIKAQQHLDALTNISSKSIYLAAYGHNREEVLLANDHIHKKLQEYKDHQQIINYSSIGGLVQSEKIQQQKIDRWNHFWNTETVEKTKQNLLESGAELGFKPYTFNSFYTLLKTHFTPIDIDGYRDLNTISVDDYIATDSSFTTITSLIKVDEAQAQTIKNAFKGQKNTLVIDRQEMNETFLGGLKNDFSRLIKYSVLAVLLVLFFFYRSFSLTLVTMVPIFVTWFLTLGIMGFLGVEFNIFNIIICSFIFGLGIDYSIFITNGMLHELRTGEKIVPTHKTSIILSVITTILGVGVLIFAKHPALYSISLVSIIGILSAMMMAFTLQPQLFKLFIGSSTKRPISLRVLLHSLLSSTYYALGCVVFSFISTVLMKVIPISKKIKMAWFHKICSKFLKSVLYSNPFVRKKIINPVNESFEKPAVIIANHTSALDSLTIGMLHPKIIFLVNDWVYNSPVFKMAAQLAEFYPVSEGVEKGVEHLQKKVNQGYSLMAFPEGTRSNTNKIRRFHKGAFYIAEKLHLDIIPVMIHGNSEVQPKGSIVISNGGITVKILDRISLEDNAFGTTYTQRTKAITSFFRQKFDAFRNEMEHETYFHPLVLKEYRYKGDALYKTVRQDLETYKSTYHQILRALPKKTTITHLSQEAGQLDFLLSLDGADRTIYAYLTDADHRLMLKNSFIAKTRKKIKVADSLKEALAVGPKVLMVDRALLETDKVLPAVLDHLEVLVLLKDGKKMSLDTLARIFKERYSDEVLTIYNRRTENEAHGEQI